MLIPQTSFDDIVENDNSSLIKVMRFCLSDCIPKSMSSVLTEDTPLSYALDTTKKHGVQIFDKFGKADFPENIKLTDTMKMGWVTDTVLETASLYRITQLRSDTRESAMAGYASTLPYILTLSMKRKSDSGDMLGLTRFYSNAQDYLKTFEDRRDRATHPLIDRLVERVGDMNAPDFILHDPVWQKVVSQKPDGFTILRSFLAIAVIAHIHTEKYYVEDLGIPRDVVLSDIETFVGLRSSEHITVADVRSFLSDVEHYRQHVPQHQMTYSVLDEPFWILERQHSAHFGNTFSLNKTINLRSEEDRPDWVFLRTLGVEWIPERVIVTDDLPCEMAEELVENHFEALYKSPIADKLKERGVNIPDTIPKNKGYIKAAMEDYLTQLLVLRRFIHKRRVPMDEAESYVAYTSHCLLVLSDPKVEQYGVSLIHESLYYHFVNRASQFTEREKIVLGTLIATWNDLSLLKPHRMSKVWKRILNDTVICQRIRLIIFSIIEMMAIEEKENFNRYFNVPREELFEYIDMFAEYLATEPTHAEVRAFVESFPIIKESIMIESVDRVMWAGSFNMIKQ